MKTTVLIALFIFSNLVIFAQQQEFKGKVFSLTFHESYQPDVIHSETGKSYPVYTTGETFISIKEFDKYPNAAKYADFLENNYLDMDSVYTQRTVDTLDNMPVIHLLVTDERKSSHFIQHFYFFDDGKQTFQISLSGIKENQRLMEQRFQVTKDSFRFVTKSFNHRGISISLPVIMSTHSIGFWSGAYDKDYNINQIMIVAGHHSDIKYEAKLKELDKTFKSLKAVPVNKEAFTVSGMKATKYSAAYNEKFKTGSEQRSEYNYVIEHPSGGIYLIRYKSKPGAIDILDKKLDAVIRELSFN